MNKRDALLLAIVLVPEIAAEGDHELNQSPPSIAEDLSAGVELLGG